MHKNEYIRKYSNFVWKHRISDINNAVKENTNKIYHSILSRYYDGHILYYSLSDEDRELIDHIINMHF